MAINSKMDINGKLTMIDSQTGEKTIVGGVKKSEFTFSSAKDALMGMIMPPKDTSKFYTAQEVEPTLVKPATIVPCNTGNKIIMAGDTVNFNVSVSDNCTLDQFKIVKLEDPDMAILTTQDKDHMDALIKFINSNNTIGHTPFLDGIGITKSIKPKVVKHEGFSPVKAEYVTPPESCLDGFVATCRNCGSVAVPKSNIEGRVEVDKDIFKQEIVVVSILMFTCDECGDEIDRMVIKNHIPQNDLYNKSKW